MKKEIERFYKKLSKIKTDNPPAEIQAHHNFKRKKRIKKDKFGICLKHCENELKIALKKYPESVDYWKKGVKINKKRIKLLKNK